MNQIEKETTAFKSSLFRISSHSEGIVADLQLISMIFVPSLATKIEPKGVFVGTNVYFTGALPTQSSMTLESVMLYIRKGITRSAGKLRGAWTLALHSS